MVCLRSSTIIATLLLPLLEAQATAASKAAESISSRPTFAPRPEFLELDRSTLSTFLALAKDRHNAAIQAARQAYYWENDYVENQEKDCVDIAPLTAVKSEIDAIQVETMVIAPPSTWSLPDFPDDFANEIKVTRGASTSTLDSNDANLSSPLFSSEECRQVIDAAEEHFKGRAWTTLPSGQYNVAGFWIKSIPEVHEWFNRMVEKRLFPLLQREFPDFCSTINNSKCPLVVDNAYVFKYTPETGRRTSVHTDSGCLSFTISLGGAYEGGGTWIEGLQQQHTNSNGATIHMQAGHVTVRPGGVRHCGQAVTDGTRYVIGGFCMHAQKVEYTRMLIGLGAELAEKGEFEKAKDALEAAVMINPKFDGAYTHLASAYQKLNRPDKAQQALEYCLRCVNSVNGEVAFTLGMRYFEQGKLEEARRCLLDVCLRVDDGDVDSMMALAQICSKEGKTEEEGQWYERIISTQGASTVVTASAYSNLGALKEGQEDEIELYRKALDLVSDNFEIRYSLGSALGAKEEWAAAAHAFRLAVNSAEDDDMKLKSLKNLYTVAIKQIQQEPPPASQEEMVKKLQHIMGLENYNQLSASSTRHRLEKSEMNQK